MGDANKLGALDGKPKRINFKTDDEFGEAYAYWMARQIRTSSAATIAKTAPAKAPQPVARPALPSPALAQRPLSRKSEAEREAWNISTKARFWRAKTSPPKTGDTS